MKLNSGTDYKGVLACLDGYMNIAMEQTEEYVDGQLKAKYGDCFIRGNNGEFEFVFFSPCFGLFKILVGGRDGLLQAFVAWICLHALYSPFLCHCSLLLPLPFISAA